MGIISIEIEEVGVTGLIWLFFTYGYVLFAASNLISEGSDLLLLVPSLAGLVGGVVLPLLGAVPDGAIMLFSGLGDLDAAQANLSVGVGALAGSSIMLLTISLALSVFAGRVDLDENGKPNYFGKPKLNARKSLWDSLFSTGVVLTQEVNAGSKIMMATTISYLIIQIPASYLKSPDWKIVGAAEKNFALAGLAVCVTAFVSYLVLQYRMASGGKNFDKVVLEMKKKIDEGQISLRACLFEFFEARYQALSYRSILDEEEEKQALLVKSFDHKAFPLMKQLLQTPFNKYDRDDSHTLDRAEIKAVFLDLNETRADDFVDEMLENYDMNRDGQFSFEEFAVAAFATLKREFESGDFTRVPSEDSLLVDSGDDDDDDNEDGEEEEEIPEQFIDLPPAEQQAAIKKQAFTMLFIGTFSVVLFSDPMVDVIGEIARRINVSSFYVSFTLVPLASNASEVIASQFYAKKKTSKTISVSISALEGAAAMNNTFGLAIFLGLIYFRGLAWEFTAETITIVLIQVIVGVFLLLDKVTYFSACIILGLFPFSIALVAVLEAFGLD